MGNFVRVELVEIAAAAAAALNHTVCALNSIPLQFLSFHFVETRSVSVAHSSTPSRRPTLTSFLPLRHQYSILSLLYYHTA